MIITFIPLSVVNGINQRNRLKTKGDYQERDCLPRGNNTLTGPNLDLKRGGRKRLPALPTHVRWSRVTIAHLTSSRAQWLSLAKGWAEEVTLICCLSWATLKRCCINWKVTHAEEKYTLLAWSTETICKHQTKQKLGATQQNTLKRPRSKV